MPMWYWVRRDKEASQVRDYWVAKDATLRAARPDPFDSSSFDTRLCSGQALRCANSAC